MKGVTLGDLKWRWNVALHLHFKFPRVQELTGGTGRNCVGQPEMGVCRNVTYCLRSETNTILELTDANELKTRDRSSTLK